MHTAGIRFEQYTADALTISMQALPADCWACGSPEATGAECGIPIYEGFVLHNDYEDEWGGAPACPRCFELQNKLTKPLPRHEFLELAGRQ